MVLSRWDRVNLFAEPVKRWSDREAAASAASIDVGGRPAVVVLGAHVARAFGIAYDPLAESIIDGTRHVVVPHPSGRCRWWNDPANVAAATSVVSRITEEWGR
jgi:hypothetical protein